MLLCRHFQLSSVQTTPQLQTEFYILPIIILARRRHNLTRGCRDALPDLFSAATTRHRRDLHNFKTHVCFMLLGYMFFSDTQQNRASKILWITDISHCIELWWTLTLVLETFRMSLCRVLTRSRGLARRHRFPARSCTSYPLLHPELDTFHARLGVEDFKRDFNTYVGQHHALHTAVQQQHLRASSTLPSERRHTLPQEPPMCQCGIPKIVRVVSKVGPNMGREFFVCPKPMGTQCRDDFQWCDEPSPPACSCGKPKVKRIVRKSGPNTGREFFTCPKPYIPACTSSFEWCDTDFKGPGPKWVILSPEITIKALSS